MNRVSPSRAPLGPSRAPLGTHTSVSGGLATAFGRAAELQCDAMQIFVKNASQWRGKELLDAEAEAFRAAHAESPVGPLLAHASYLINLCATDPAVFEKSLPALADELARCARLGVHGLVLHPGAHLGAGEEAGMDKVAASLDSVLAAVGACGTRILLENTAGQGSCLGYKLEHLAGIRARVSSPERVGFCLDTCHAFAAGYPIHEPAGFEEFVDRVEEELGLDALGCLHVNDSVCGFGSRRDRHAHIGEGLIGLDLFARLLAEPRFAAVPMIVETDPEDDMAGHRKDLATLRGLLG